MAFTYCCERCDFKCGQEPKFYSHLVNVHNTVPQEELIRVRYGGVHPTCKCGCGENVTLKSWRHTAEQSFIRGHNARVSSSFSNKDTIEKMKTTRSQNLASGKSQVWNKGLTKKTNESLATAAAKKSATLLEKYATGKITSWQKGLTTESSESLRKMSKTKIEKHVSGVYSVWNKGMTSATSDVVRNTALKISDSYKNRVAGRRLSVEEVNERLCKSGFEIADNDSYVTRRVSRINVRHISCGTVQQKSLAMIQETGTCVKCDDSISVGQKEIYEFMKSLCSNVIKCDRTVIGPLELDMWAPDQGFAVEYNGLYWHSEKYRDSKYHDEKSRKVKEKGASLLHVYSDEWSGKRNIVESMIERRLGVAHTKVYARKCQVVSMSVTQRRDFFEQSHISGDARAKRSWGLVYEGKIIAAVSVRKPFHKKWSQRLEIARFACSPKVTVIGALGKLSKHALAFAKSSKLEGLMTYVDLGIGDGHSYKKVGYAVVGSTSPTFWWTDGLRRYNRFKYKADTEAGMTQEMVAKQSNVSKIYGCRNLVLTLS